MYALLLPEPSVGSPPVRDASVETAGACMRNGFKRSGLTAMTHDCYSGERKGISYAGCWFAHIGHAATRVSNYST
jgi:hypothetical protein